MKPWTRCSGHWPKPGQRVFQQAHCTCGREPANGSWNGWRHITLHWWAATAACTDGSYASKDYRTWLPGRIRHHRKNHGVSSGAQFFREMEPNGGAAPGNGAVAADPALL